MSTSLAGASVADVTGKIAGRVVDKETGEALTGVNIIVVGTTLGAATDIRGEYFILQVPPGLHSVRASMVGYQTVTKEAVQVYSGLTARVDFSLSMTVLELETVTIVADRPMVQRDVTSSTRTVTSQELKSIPNVRSFQDVVRVQPGVVGLNLRGGRVRETLYMIDGVPIANPVSGGFSGLSIPPEAIAELTLITGGFNAEYGQAQSGIVNIVTKDGSPALSGGISWKTDRFAGSGWNTDYATVALSGPDPISSRVLPYLGVRVPGQVDFYLTTDVDQTDTYVKNMKRLDSYRYLLFDLAGRQSNRHSANAKLTYRITPSHKLSLAYRNSRTRTDPYNHFWKFLGDSTLTRRSSDSQYLLSWTHTLSPRTFYTLNVSRLEHRGGAGVGSKIPPEYPKRFQPVGDTDRDGFADRGSEMFWGNDQMISHSVKMDLTSQIHSHHLIKAGLEGTFYNLRETSISYPGWHYPGRDTIPGEWPEYGAIRTAYDVYPKVGSFYIQDKMEFEGLVVNLGLRYDYWMPGEEIAQEKYQVDWENRTGIAPKIDKVKGNLSPRLGISYPVTERTVMYFAYGRFTQIPSLLHVYRDAYVGATAGNPYHLDSEVTSAYEIGFNHQFADDMMFEVKGFLKDVSGLIGVTTAGHFGLPVLLYVNKDYGTTRGLELQVKKQYTNFTIGTLSYTLAWASGRSSNPDQEAWFISVFKQPPRLRDYRLDWDQRHTLNFNVSIRALEGMHAELFGFRLPEQWGIDVLYRFGSGLPYTPPTRGEYALQSLYNTRTGPWSSTLDIRLDKSFKLHKMSFTVFAEILNALGRRNPVILNAATGKPYKFGDTTDFPDYKIFSWREIQQYLNPLRVGPSTQIFLGLAVNW